MAKAPTTSVRASAHLPANFIDTYKVFKKMTGIPQETQMVLSTSLHNAYTNSKQVCFGAEWVDSAIPENFHGFDNLDEVIAMNQFVIAHEVGHLSVQPGWQTSWGKDIGEWPIDYARQPKWSNVFSDVLVNTHIMGARDWKRSSNDPEVQKIIDLMPWSQRWHLKSRICKNTNKHDMLRAAGTLPDNRYQPPGMARGAYDPSDPDDVFKPDEALTPLYQVKTGHGRGFQVYPPLSNCMSKPDSWRKIKLDKSYTLVQCSSCDEIMPDNILIGSKCPRCRTACNPYHNISAGTYTVTKTQDLNQEINPDNPTFPWYYEVGGKWIPFYLTQELCPDCGLTASCDLTEGFSTVTADPSLSACSEQSTLWRVLVMQEFAGFRALQDGFRGSTDIEAGHKFLEAIGIVAHFAEMRCQDFPRL